MHIRDISHQVFRLKLDVKMCRGPSSLESLSPVTEGCFRGLPWGAYSPVDRQVRSWAIYPLPHSGQQVSREARTCLQPLTSGALCQPPKTYLSSWWHRKSSKYSAFIFSWVKKNDWEENPSDLFLTSKLALSSSVYTSTTHLVTTSWIWTLWEPEAMRP